MKGRTHLTNLKRTSRQFQCIAIPDFIMAEPDIQGTRDNTTNVIGLDAMHYPS